MIRHTQPYEDNTIDFNNDQASITLAEKEPFLKRFMTKSVPSITQNSDINSITYRTTERQKNRENTNRLEY